MSDTKQTYTPKFPQSHELLLEVYKGLMTAKPKDVAVWAERFKAHIQTLQRLKEDGVLPPLFTRNFYQDVRDVAGQVHELIVTSELTQQQKTLTFGMANLQNMFGAH